MSPPPQISPAAAAARAASGMLLCGGPMLLAQLILERIVDNDAEASSRVGALRSSSRVYVSMLVLGALAMAALGSWRAAITHQQRGRLALQSCALVIPGMLLARLAGVTLLAETATMG